MPPASVWRAKNSVVVTIDDGWRSTYLKLRALADSHSLRDVA